MARYGGGSEDFNREKARLDAIAARIEEINKKEIATQGALEDLGQAERRGAESTRQRARAKREATELDAREARVAQQNARATQADTAAIERNTRMRQARARAARQEAIDLTRAAQGARDPLFGRAAGLGADPSQYRMRREFGIGSGRASAMQQALAAGYRPGGPGRLHGPATHGQAAVAAERQFMATLTAEEKAYVEATRAASQFAAAKQPARTLAMNAALQREGATLGTVSQAMHRHGALTSEFIAATARGETTLREIGNQGLITAGKFAGWTAAATSIFAVAGALQQVGHGAIAAQGGVHTLDRVLNQSTYTGDQAQQSFSELSRKFNVSPDVAIDAIYRMGQRFHNFPDAVKAAEASLYSFKTGEVDVATSTENLLAIVNGFGLSAQDLGSVYDQINQAQNTFGIRIRDTEAGLAKAAGTYRNSGGDLNYLLALTVAIGRATNRSGQEIGTGLARGVNQIRNSVNQARLEAQGVDVIPGNFQKTLQNALKAAQRPGADQNEIARGLFGNQYARLIAPVLRDQRVLNAALKDTSPEKSKGSAQRELARVLKQADEQIHRLGFSLQQLGAALARAGAFAFAGLFLKALNEGLHVAVLLVETFDRLPRPLREALSIVAQIGVAMKLIQRFGGENLASGRLAFLANPDAQYAARARRGLRDASGAATDEAERTQRRAYTVRHAAATADLEAQRALAARDRAIAAAATGGTQAKLAAVDAEAAHVAAAKQAERLAAQAATAEVAAADARKIAAAADEESVAAAKMSAAEMRAYAETRRLAVPVENRVPSAAGVSTAGVVGDTRVRNVERAATQGARELDQMGRLSTAGAAAQLTLARSYGRVGEHLERGGLAGKAVNRAAEKTIGLTGRAITVAQGVGRGIGGIGGRLRGFAAALGPLDIALAGFFGIEFVMGQLEDMWKNAEDQQRALTNRTGTLEHLHRQRHLAAQASKGSRSFIADFVGGDAGDALQDALDKFSGAADTRRAAKTDLDTFHRIQKAQREAAARGTFIPMLTADQLVKRVDRDAQLRKQGIISQREFDRRMALHAKEARTLWEPNQKELQSALSALTGANRQQGKESAYRESLKKLDPKGLQKEAQAMAALVADFGTGGGNLRRLRDVYAETQRRLSGKHDAQSIIDLSTARQQFFHAVQQSAQQELQADLAYARTEAQRRTAYAHAQRTLRRGFLTDASKNVGEARRRVSEANAKAREARRAAQAGPTGPPSPVQDPFGLGDLYTHGGIPQIIGQSQEALNKAADRAKQDAKKAKEALHKARAARRQAERKLREAQAELRDAAYSDREQGRQINLSLAQSYTGSSLSQANLAISSARQQVADAARTYGVRSRQWKTAMTNLNQAMNQRDQAILAGVEADNALLLARAGSDPLAQAAASVQAAMNTYRATRAAKHADPNQVKQAYAALLQARTAQADAIRQEAQQVVELEGQIAAARLGGAGADAVAVARAGLAAARRQQSMARTRVERLQALLAVIQAQNAVEDAIRDAEQARYELTAAQNAENPVRVANIERKAAKAAIDGTHGAARLRARAAYVRARDASRAAALQGKEDDIDFEQQMGRIDVQDAIERYQTLLKLRHLTKQQKRDIRLKIHGLQSELESEASGFDLDVGNLKLPTIYDVRKAFDPIRRQVKDARRALGHGDVGDAASAGHDGTGDYGLTGGRSRSGKGGRIDNYSVHDARKTVVQATIQIYVNDKGSANEVYDALDKVMGTHVKARLKSRHHRRGRG